MKKLLPILLLISCFSLTSCEEEIVLDLDKNVPRLVIEGNLFVDESLYNNIHLSTTTDFYSNVFPSVNDAQVSIKDLTNNVDYPFTNIGKGDFSNTDFRPKTDNQYELTVVYKNEIYKATSTLLESPEITNIEQKNDGGFDGDTYEFRFYFQDNPDEENYYLVQMRSPKDHAFGTLSDQFTNGNLMSDLYFYDKEDVKPGNQLRYAINSISKDYYNYLGKLLSISGEMSNPFASPMGTIKGNIVNQTNETNFALGYFHIAQRNHYTYIIK